MDWMDRVGCGNAMFDYRWRLIWMVTALLYAYLLNLLSNVNRLEILWRPSS